jgi:hypothetical protein
MHCFAGRNTSLHDRLMSRPDSSITRTVLVCIQRLRRLGIGSEIIIPMVMGEVDDGSARKAGAI